MTNPFENPNESTLLTPVDADDTATALTEAIIADDDNWVRVLGIGSLGD